MAPVKRKYAPPTSDITINYIHMAALGLLGVLCLSAMFIPLVGMNAPAQTVAGDPPALLLVVIGLVIGCYGTIVGIGGGPLIVPVLFFFYGWDNEFLVATSLFVVLLNALSGSVGYAVQKRIDYWGGVKFSLAALPGALLSGFIHSAFMIPMFDTIFGVFLILLALWLVASVNNLEAIQRRQSNKFSSYRHVYFRDAFHVRYDFYSNDRLGIGMNLALGFFVGFLGIGGGVFQVPILLFLLCYPPHLATSTSHFITGLTCLFALIPHLWMGNVMFGSALPIGLGVVIGAQVGAQLAAKIQSKFLIYLFILILVIFALELFL